MSREVRMIKPGWEHPKSERGYYEPLLDRSFSGALAEWKDARLQHMHDLAEFEEDYGAEPSASDYMPEWAEGEATLFVMYESVSEGTPISPAFSTPEELARWLSETGADAGAGMTASYEGWLRVALGGYAPSFVIINGVMMSGVEGAKK